MKLLAQLEKKKECWLLIIVSIVFFVLRLPSLFEPHWYGDEGIYQTMGLAISQGATLYKEIWDNKPPLLYVLYGLFAGDQFALRLLSLLFGIASTIVFFTFARKLYATISSIPTSRKATVGFSAMLFFAFFFATPLLEGNIANAENFMLLPICIAAYIVFINRGLANPKALFIAGIFSSLGFLLKAVGIFDFAAFALFLAIANFKDMKRVLQLFTQLLPFAIGFFVPIVLVTLYFFAVGAFKEFYQGTFTQMVGYVGYGNYFLFPQGLLIFKLLLLATTVLLIFFRRKSLSGGITFILVWLTLAVFSAFFAQRPYIHYLLVLLPPFSLFMGYTLGVIKKQTNTEYEKKIRASTAILLVFLLVLIFKNFNLYDKSFSYYGNFLSFMNGTKNTYEYYGFFDRNTPRDYQIAEFVKMNTNRSDSIFVWGNNAQVYKMTNKLPPGRFTVLYHMTAREETLEETKMDLEKQNPKLIIIAHPSPMPFSIVGYTHRINIQDASIYERITQ